MELKRILAKNTKSANDKAVALYGPDVLVISSARVRGRGGPKKPVVLRSLLAAGRWHAT